MNSKDTTLDDTVKHLSYLSQKNYYNPYSVLDWPPSISDDNYWMTPELMSTWKTAADSDLDESTRHRLSKWESINFYSLNVHGIRELMFEVGARIHTPGYERLSDYFHHMLGEENEHMWFFAKFCKDYGGKIYPNRSMKLTTSDNRQLQDLMVFSRLLIFEEIVDVVNREMGTDSRLPAIVQQINALHHKDESRHVTFGRRVVSHIWERLSEGLDEAEQQEVRRYLENYLGSSLQSLCTPDVYRDAGIPEPYAFRRRVLVDTAYDERLRKLSSRTVAFLRETGIFRQ